MSNSYICKKCEVILTDDNWFASSKKACSYACKSCLKDRARNYYRKNNVRLTKKLIQYRYGISETEYNNLFIKADNKCQICKKEQIGKSLFVDHSHETKEIRGLLCQKCNSGLGLFNDSTELLKKAIEYLESSKK